MRKTRKKQNNDINYLDLIPEQILTKEINAEEAAERICREVLNGKERS